MAMDVCELMRALRLATIALIGWIGAERNAEPTSLFNLDSRNM
jgi:hypothetical protein